jgi:hypothetical protein
VPLPVFQPAPVRRLNGMSSRTVHADADDTERSAFTNQAAAHVPRELLVDDSDHQRS